MPLFAAAQPAGLWPFAVLFISLAVLVVLITVMRVHAFLALLAAAILAGGLATQLPGEYGTLPDAPQDERSHWVQAVELTSNALGKTASSIAIIVALASIIGVCLLESGAADKIVRKFLALFGEKRIGPAIVCSGYILSIPIFFETYFMLLMPLARALYVRTGRDYMLYILAICCGGTITHTLVAPHPGPAAMAKNLHVDLGLTILVGLVAGVVPVLCSWFFIRWVCPKVNAPMRDTAGVTEAELRDIVHRKDEELPSFLWSILPVFAPLGLIGAASVAPALGLKTKMPALFEALEFFGTSSMALFVGTVLGIILLMRTKKISLREVSDMMSAPLATAGVIILVTSSGGAFGFMLQNARVGDAIKELAHGRDVNLIVLGWFVAAVIRVAQGSATVSMMTTSAMIYPLTQATPLPYHPVYLFLAIAFGSKMLSWMNDAGFWTIGKLSGFTEGETLKTWSMMVSLISVTGLCETLLFSQLLPFKPH